jgi:predicted deacylase
MNRLIDHISWERIPIGAGAAVGQVEIAIGSVGTGRPLALITAGIHGDEGPWGAWALHKLLASHIDGLRGSLRVVPVANPLAMEADARNAPLDTLDLNRVFPGDLNGSHTERLAAALVAHAVDGVDVVIDIHGGGSWCVNAFAFQFPGGEALSQAAGAPFLVNAPERNVTLTGYARTKGATVAAIEMGGRSEREWWWAYHIANGLERMLHAAGVLGTAVAPSPTKSIPVGQTQVLRPSRGGIFVPQLREQDVGHIVSDGTVLGRLHDPLTFETVETFIAPFPQTALLLLRPTMARIEGGAMTYVVAEPISPV